MIFAPRRPNFFAQLPAKPNWPNLLKKLIPLDQNTASKRIPLPDGVFTKLSNEVQVIKQKGVHFKVNEAKLVAAVVELFFELHLEKDRARLEAKFFDKRAYLQTLIEKSESEADLSASLNEFLGTRRTKTTAKKK